MPPGFKGDAIKDYHYHHQHPVHVTHIVALSALYLALYMNLRNAVNSKHGAYQLTLAFQRAFSSALLIIIGHHRLSAGAVRSQYNPANDCKRPKNYSKRAVICGLQPHITQARHIATLDSVCLFSSSYFTFLPLSGGLSRLSVSGCCRSLPLHVTHTGAMLPPAVCNPLSFSRPGAFGCAVITSQSGGCYNAQ